MAGCACNFRSDVGDGDTEKSEMVMRAMLEMEKNQYTRPTPGS
jgi:hypothetical protein